MTYYVEAKRYGRDHNGDLWVVDKLVDVNLSYEEADKLYKKLLRNSNNYWHDLRMKRENNQKMVMLAAFAVEGDEDLHYNKKYEALQDGIGEGQPA